MKKKVGKRIVRQDVAIAFKKQSTGWRDIKIKYVVFASISFCIFIGIGVLLIFNSSKSETDLKPSTLQVQQTHSSISVASQPTSQPTDNVSTNLANNMGEVGKAMTNWINLIAIMMAIGLFLGMFTQLKRHF